MVQQWFSFHNAMHYNVLQFPFIMPIDGLETHIFGHTCVFNPCILHRLCILNKVYFTVRE